MTAQRMRYVDHGKGGSADSLKLAEIERPRPSAGEVLVKVAYAGVNRPDIAQRAGHYPPPAEASPILGLEASGHVAALGDGCTRWQIGDAVCALTPGGGYAEYCTVPEAHSLPIPQGLSLIEAASLPENYFTVWANVFDLARLKPGEMFLVHGGSSGIGATAIQLAKAFGAQVATTAGSAAKLDFCAGLGADLVINYHQDDFVERIRRHCGGVDVVLDMVGGDYANRNISLLKSRGRLVQIAVLAGATAQVDLARIMVRRLTLTGSTLRPRSVEEKAAIATALETKVWPLFAAGKLRPVVYRRFPLAQAAQAHVLMESSAHLGKIVLEVAAG